MNKVLTIFSAAILFCSGTSNVYGEEVRLSVGLTVEPYVIRVGADDSKIKGFEVDIVREILLNKKLTAVFSHQPLKRSKISFQNKTVDAVMTVKDYYPEVKGAFISDEYITYHNFAVTLKSSGIKINNISDLKDKKLVAFQQARIALGKEFGKMADANTTYSEMADQRGQIGMFFYKRTDVIVLDRKIFDYHRKRLIGLPTKQDVVFHKLFPPSHFRIAFRRKAHRDAFNSGLKELKDSGRHKAIIDSYILPESKNKKTKTNDKK
ncbi:MAG: substrate-binding periplasmic protein [Planctomycetota bacterium]|jgi:polar amino acid transport system substrate-binding protein